MKETLTFAILLGMIAASAVSIFRAIPPGSGLLKTGKKPWACDVCMSFWSTLLIALITGIAWRVPLNQLWTAIPSYIVCLWLVRQTRDIDFVLDKAETKDERSDK